MRSISVRHFPKWVLVGAVAAISTLPALAQQTKGEFTITKEVHWGPVVLGAGTYTYSVEHHAAEVLYLRPKAGGGGHFVMASSVSRAEGPTPNRLTLERRGTDWYVRSIVLDDLDEALMFRVPASESANKLTTIATK